MRPFFIFAAGLLLSACVLHEKTPLFAESDAVLLLGDKPVSFAVFNRKNDEWVAADDPIVTAIPEGGHYRAQVPGTAEDPASIDTYAFIPIDADHYAVQAIADSEADYAIATWDGRVLLVSPLTCEALKTSLKTNLLVGFLNDACSLRPGSLPPKDVMVTLAQVAGAPTLQLVMR